MDSNRSKPLQRKAYGSIPHLPGSRADIGDKRITMGQVKMLTEKLKNKTDNVVVQEKLDGSCVSVALANGELLPLTRAGYLAITSPYKQHRIFHDWVIFNTERFKRVLKEGERICAEWLLQVHTTKYELKHEPFVAFDIFNKNNKRLVIHDFVERIDSEFIMPRLLLYGQPVSISTAMEILDGYNKHGADKSEGLVYRYEDKNGVNFLAKYVRPDHRSGLYMDQEIFNKNHEIFLGDLK